MISNEWEKHTLGEISKDIAYGYTASAQWERVGPRFLRITDIVGGLNWDTVPYCEIDEQGYKKYKLEIGDIVIARTGATTGTAEIIKEDKDAVFASYLIRFKIDESKADPFYIGHIVKSSDWKEFIKSIIGGSAQPGANAKQLSEYEIALPPISTQHHIADILSALDDKIELNRQTNASLESIARAIFKEWFVDFNFPGAMGHIQESELGMIPQGWSVAVFEDELDSERGLSYKGAGLEAGNAMPMHNLNSVYEGGGYKFDGIKYYSGEYKEKHIVRPGDLIVTNTEQGHKYLLIGYPAIVPATFGNIGIYSHHIYRVRPKPHSYLTADFIYQLLLQSEIREQVVGFANGTTVNMLKIDGLQKPKFVLPPKELISQFSELALGIRLRHEENINQSATLKSLRDTLLPKLMSDDIHLQRGYL